MPEFLFLSYETYSSYCIDLALKTTAHFGSNKIDYLISIQRGGAVMSKILSDALNVPIATIVVSSYQDMQQIKKPFVSQEISVDIRGKNIVVLDEICDTGDTLKLVTEYLQQLGPQSIFTGVLVLKSHATFLPNIHAAESDKWVVFPGELRETAEALAKFAPLSVEVLEQFDTYAKQHGATTDLLQKLNLPQLH